MADVRALLRAERAARNSAKPSRPIQNTRPTPQSTSAQEQHSNTATSSVTAGKKRKAADASASLEEPEVAEPRRKKRSRALEEGDGALASTAIKDSEAVALVSQGDLPAGFFDASHAPSSIPAVGNSLKDATPLSTQPSVVEPVPRLQAQPSIKQADTAIDEAEWAAFEADLAAPSPSPAPVTALEAIRSAAAISAAPVSASEAAEKQRQQTLARTDREARVEEQKAEREDAERFLEDEFEAMETLEGRIEALKARREALRITTAGAESEVVEGSEVMMGGDDVNGVSADEEDNEDEDEDEDWWGVRG